MENATFGRQKYLHWCKESDTKVQIKNLNEEGKGGGSGEESGLN